MKTKTLFLIASFFYAAAIAQAQNAAPFALEAGIGIGLLPTFAQDRSRNIIVPLSAMVSYRVSDKFSIDAFGGYSASQATRISSTTGTPVSIENRYSYAGLRIAAHTHPYTYDRWDVYGGMSGMYTASEVTRGPAEKSTIEEDGLPNKQTRNRFSATAFLGARYALSTHWGLWGELGFGAALVNIGISHRFVTKAVSKKQ